MPEPVKRRRRPPISCTLCRKRKIKCDKQLPCSHCIRSQVAHQCQYDNPWPSAQAHGAASMITGSLSLTSDRTAAEIVSTAAGVHAEQTEGSEFPLSFNKAVSPNSNVSTLVVNTSASSTSSPRDAESMARRIKDLEDQLARITYASSAGVTKPSSSNIETLSTGLTGPFHIELEDRSCGVERASSKSVAHKTRVFGQSHWVNGAVIFRDLIMEIAPMVQVPGSRLLECLAKCKAIARVVKSRRRPEWPTAPTPDLPPKELADDLLACYSRTFETIYRILHLPTFNAEYEALWLPGAKPNPAFIVQVKLVLAIGAECHDLRFQHRSLAIRWIYEAQTYISDPNAKSRLNLTTLQTQILLLVAREMISNAGDAIWVSAGSLIRTAMYMGLHRDPSRLLQQSTHIAEMRRRLWNTVLEISLQASLTAGGAPMINLDDFDTQPPGNYFDDDLSLSDPVPRPTGEHTPMSVAIALRESFPLRLRIVKFLNDIKSPANYIVALQLDTAIRSAYRTISKSLRVLSVEAFASQYVDLLMNRYTVAIHMPFLETALTNPSCAYSRKAAVDAALRIWCTACPERPAHGSEAASSPQEEAGDMEKVTTCVSGFFRSVPVQALFILALEVRTQILEDEGLSPASPHKDHVSVLYQGQAWLLRSIEAGETNLKGYIFQSVVIAHIKRLMKDERSEGLAGTLTDAAAEAAETGLAVMKRSAGDLSIADEGPETAVDLGSIDFGDSGMNNFDFMMDDEWMQGIDQMSWDFDESTPMW